MAIASSLFLIAFNVALIFSKRTTSSLVSIPDAAPAYQISHPDGRQWKVDSTALKLNGGVAINLKIYDGSDVYNSAKGRISWFQDGDSNLAVRHSG